MNKVNSLDKLSGAIEDGFKEAFFELLPYITIAFIFVILGIYIRNNKFKK